MVRAGVRTNSSTKVTFSVRLRTKLKLELVWASVRVKSRSCALHLT